MPSTNGSPRLSVLASRYLPGYRGADLETARRNFAAPRQHQRLHRRQSSKPRFPPMGTHDPCALRTDTWQRDDHRRFDSALRSD